MDGKKRKGFPLIVSRIAGLCALTVILSVAGMSEAAQHEKVSAGLYHTVVLKTDGTVWTWGSAPTQVKGPGGQGYLTDIKDIEAGARHTTTIKTDGTVWAWGSNAYGQLGNGTKTDSVTPVQVKGAGGQGYFTDVAFISAGGNHTAVIKTGGTVWTWGSNRYGQLGNGTTADSATPVQVKGAGGQGYFTDVAFIAAGFQHTFAIKSDGTVWAWGRNAYGQLGNGTKTDSVTPVQVKGAGGQGYLTAAAAIAPGWDHTLVLKKDGTVWACGMSWNGLLGNGEKTDSAVLVQVKGAGGKGYLTDVVAISANWRHNLALKKDGTVWAWGRNQEGQLGNGTIVPADWKSDPGVTLYEYIPVQVKGVGGEGYFTDVAGIAVAAEHSVAFKTDGTVFAWGYNIGQLGIGPWGYPLMRSNPAQIPGLNLKN